MKTQTDRPALNTPRRHAQKCSCRNGTRLQTLCGHRQIAARLRQFNGSGTRTPRVGGLHCRPDTNATSCFASTEERSLSQVKESEISFPLQKLSTLSSSSALALPKRKGWRALWKEPTIPNLQESITNTLWPVPRLGTKRSLGPSDNFFPDAFTTRQKLSFAERKGKAIILPCHPSRSWHVWSMALYTKKRGDPEASHQNEAWQSVQTPTRGAVGKKQTGGGARKEDRRGC